MAVSLEPLRILIVRLSAIGDVIHGLPVLNALRDHYPRAKLAWVVEGRAGDLLEGHPSLNLLIRVRRGWLSSPREVGRLRCELFKQRFDMTIDLQGLTKSAVMARLSGAKRRLGFGGVDGRELSQWLNTERVVASAEHVVERNLQLLSPLGIHGAGVSFRLPTNAAATTRLLEFLQQQRLLNGYAILNPGAGWASKRWPGERFAALAQALGAKTGLKSVITWAGEEELRVGTEIVKQAAGQAVLAPPTSLIDLAAWCRHAQLFVSGDTGPLHLAAAVGTKCVGLFGPVSALRNGPYGAEHQVLQKVCLLGNSRTRRGADNSAMQLIEVDEALHASLKLLQRTPSRQMQVA